MIRWLFLWAVAAAAVPGFAQPASGAGLPQPGPAAELLIGLAVAESHCSGVQQRTIARHRPLGVQARATLFKQAGQAMSQRYAQAYGDGWAAVLAADMARLRDRFAQQPDMKRFCRQAALQARDLSIRPDSAVGVFYDNNGQLRPGSVLLGPLPW